MGQVLLLTLLVPYLSISMEAVRPFKKREVVAMETSQVRSLTRAVVLKEALTVPLRGGRLWVMV